MGCKFCGGTPPDPDPTRYRFQKHVVENAKISIALVGDALTGKTTAAINYIEKRFVDVTSEDVSQYIMTANALDYYEKEVNVDQKIIRATVYDTPGHQNRHAEDTRKIIFEKVDAVMLCFAANSRTNEQEDVERWLAEIRAAKPGVPIIVLLTKSDLLYKPEDPREPITLRAKDIISI